MSVIFLRAAAGAGCAALCLAASGRAEPSAPLPVEALKRAYIECEDAAQITRLGSGDAEACALLYEELKERGFGKDFRALLDWYRDEMRQRLPAS